MIDLQAIELKKSARRMGAWSIALGAAVAAVGVAAGVGCIVIGGKLLSRF